MKKDMSEYQEKTFIKLQNLKYNIQSLSGYIQNDFGRMLEDGYTTKKDITSSIEDMDENFDKFIDQFNILRKEVRYIMEYYSE